MLARKTPLRRTPFKRGKPKPERLALPVVPKALGRMKVTKGPWRSAAYRKAILSSWCLVCGRPAQEAHHIREFLPRTMGVRVGDEWCAPLCSDCHRDLHKVNNATFWEARGVDPVPWCREHKAIWDCVRALEEVDQ